MQLSFSQISTLFRCPQAWKYKYIDKVQPDYTDTEALQFGKAYHHMLQSTEYKICLDGLEEKLIEIANMFGLNSQQAYALAACYMSSCKDWKLVEEQLGRLKIVGTEVEINTENIIGYIDNVVVNEDSGTWYIVELKTASFVTDYRRLPYEPQIAIYTLHKNIIADSVKVEEEKYGGVLYREVIKTRKQPRNKESILEYAERVSYEIVCNTWLVKPRMDYVDTWLKHARKEAEDIQEGRKEALKVYGKNCFMWGKPCEYFSRCYAASAPEDVKALSVTSALLLSD